MEHHELHSALREIAAAGSAGLAMPDGPNSTQRALERMNYAYVPYNALASVGLRAPRIHLTSQGMTWLKQNPQPIPAPPADDRVDPVPAPVPPAHPAPVEKAAQPPEQGDALPDDVLDGAHTGPDLDGPGIEPAPPEPAAPVVPAAFVEAALAEVRDAHTMLGLSKHLIELRYRHQAELPPPAEHRPLLPLNRRNATKWAKAPHQYALQGVDE